MIGLLAAVTRPSASGPTSIAMPHIRYLGIIPVIVLLGGAVLMLGACSVVRHPVRARVGTVGMLVIGATSLGLSIWQWTDVQSHGAYTTVDKAVVVDGFSAFVAVLLSCAVVLTALVGDGYLRREGIDGAEYHVLALVSASGAMLMGQANDLIVVFLGLEILSIALYVLAAFNRRRAASAEGALKYFLLGSFAAAIMLYGFALLYGATGHTDLVGIGAALSHGAVKSPLVVLALAMVLAGLVFKVSGVPFHMWTPDAYEGAPTPATTYMAVAVKSGGFAMMMRVLLTAFGDPKSSSWAAGWPPVLAVVAVLTMTVANLIAGRQDSVKRMLAYSSIAHAGYLLIGVVASMRAAPEAQASVLFYLVTYTVSTAGAFGALVLCGSRGAEAVSYEDLSGIGRRHPAAALAFALFLMSLAGIPPTAGFFGKWFIFRAAMDGGFYWLALIAFINSVIGVYYYLRVLVYMYMREPAAGAPVATPMRSAYVNTALLVSAALVLLLGLMPSRSLGIAIAAATGFGG